MTIVIPAFLWAGIKIVFFTVVGLLAVFGLVLVITWND